VGLGLGVGIGAAVACPGRIVAAVIGDGGAKMSLLELDTAVRHALPLAVIVFDDGGYGAEVHDFEPHGVPVDIARFPSRDFAAVARALGATGITVRSVDDLDALTGWLDQPGGPIVLDCKVDPDVDGVSVLTEAGAAEWSLPAPHSLANQPAGGTC
jgi:5-guanidino-2-oxopentanoate decarboxylase